MKKLTVPHKKIITDFLLAFLVLCLMIILSFQDSWDFLNWKLYDTFFTIRRHTPVRSEHVVIVCIDQESLDYISERMGFTWPFPREFHAMLVRYLTKHGARAILFDAIFSEPDIDRTGAPGEYCDSEFGKAISESGITYLSAAVQEGGRTANPYDDTVFLEESDLFRNLPLANYTSAVFPIQILSEGARGIVFANFEPDNDDKVRRYPLVFKFNGRLAPASGYGMARNLLSDQAFRKTLFAQNPPNAFVDQESKILLNWYGKGGPDGVFPYYSYHAVFVSFFLEERNEQSLFPEDAFTDKIVMVGSNASGLLDLKNTPFTHIEPYPGVEIHATALENLLSDDFIYRIPGWVIILSLACTAVLLFIINSIFKKLKIFISIFGVFFVFVTLLSYVLIHNNIWLPPADILINGTVVFAALIISGYFSESKDKRVMRKQFERYVNDSVLEEILENPNAVDLHGRTIGDATVMATDIANFTTISEELAPHQVVSRLNDYLSEVSEALIDNSAFINKYIGDAILAVYGAFEEHNHKRNACMAALHASEIISRKVAQAISVNETPLITRFGISSGEITMGNIGSARKTEYTVIGDTVNSAFRLEGLNKYFKTTILVSESTKDGAGDEFVFRLMDIVRYKGKVTPVRIYELLGLKDNINSEKLAIRDKFEEALVLYRNAEFHQAQKLLKELTEKGDEPSEVFYKRCQDFIEKPPPPDWSGVWVMLRK